jgi:DNA modification methylase
MSRHLNEFCDWTGNRVVHCIGSNSQSDILPFQAWQHFKEAFAPELLKRAVEESGIPVHTCTDPFGGSGTTALACQFLGVEPTTIEINPYLSDLIEAKLSSYNADALARDFGTILKQSRKNCELKSWRTYLPPTFIQPGKNERWIFNSDVADEALRIRMAIEALASDSHRRFFKVQLGGILGTVSNVRTSGKGRRYRSGWAERSISRPLVRSLFTEATQRAIQEVHRFAARATKRYRLIRGDARTSVAKIQATDLVVFSPPYPNSFDYTDVYNVELWMLGYLKNSNDNRALRASTLSSHVQIKRAFDPPPTTSKKLNRILKRLSNKDVDLWSPHIPAMLGSYFAELSALLQSIKPRLTSRGSIWMIVGDSQYGGIRVDVAGILRELSTSSGYSIRLTEPFRSMRSSPQQGGKRELSETLLVLDKR